MVKINTNKKIILYWSLLSRDIDLFLHQVCTSNFMIKTFLSSFHSICLTSI